jgi:hypothetical protein
MLKNSAQDRAKLKISLSLQRSIQKLARAGSLKLASPPTISTFFYLSKLTSERTFGIPKHAPEISNQPKASHF